VREGKEGSEEEDAMFKSIGTNGDKEEKMMRA